MRQPGNGARGKYTIDMKISNILSVAALAVTLCACDDFSLDGKKGSGTLYWSMDPVIRVVSTKASADIPDTNDFILKVADASGKLLYDGSYGDSPESLEVESGTYSVTLRSGPFTRPEFASPQYGDDREVEVKSGESVHVKLVCRQVNSGVRLKIDPSFLTYCPDGVLYVKGDDGKLMYSYTEKRIAYFNPGKVSLILYEEGKDKELLSRDLLPSEILTVNISAPHDPVSGVSVSAAVDTSRIWTTEDYLIGGGSSGNDGSVADDAISVADAASHVGESGVWVYGYIVGGDLTSAGKTVKTEGITKATHLAIAARSSVTAKASCVAVELPKGAVRDALNLVDHPEYIGTRIYVKGNIVSSYFGTVGLKGTSEYQKK